MMVTQAAPWMFAVVVGVLLMLLPVLRRAGAEKLRTFQATVLDKKKESTIAYVGVFIPIETHYLLVDGGIEVKVDRRTYDSVDIGDSVMVSEYGDGSHRLEGM